MWPTLAPSPVASGADARMYLDRLRSLDLAVPKALTDVMHTIDLVESLSFAASTTDALIASAYATGLKLTADKLAAMVTAEAAKRAASQERANIATSLARIGTHRFHDALVAGAADEIVDQIRPRFMAAAAVVARAKSEIRFGFVPLDSFIDNASADELSLYQAARSAVAEMDRLTTALRTISPGSGGAFPVFVVPTALRLDAIAPLAWWFNVEPHLPELSQLMHRRQDPGVDASPWSVAPVAGIRSVAEVRERVRHEAEGAWDSSNVQHPDSVNPYRRPDAEPPEPQPQYLTPVELAERARRERRARRNRHPGDY